MVKTLGQLCGIPICMEVFLLSLVQIGCGVFDSSLLNLKSNLHRVWEHAFDPLQFSINSQINIKYIMSGIIVVQAFSVHLNLALCVVMLWPAMFVSCDVNCLFIIPNIAFNNFNANEQMHFLQEEYPTLLFPWLFLSLFKHLGTGIVSFLTGMYVCFVRSGIEQACWNYALAQVVQGAPSFYMWFCVLRFVTNHLFEL